MKFLFQIFGVVFFTFSAFSQNGFEFSSPKSKVKIPFQLINNLVIIPIQVNGVEMNFLLDTGVEETILFSLEDKSEVQFFNVEKIKLRGLGSKEAIEGLKSTENTLELPGLISQHETIIIVLDEAINFSSILGIPVNGIIGYAFFKANLVEINYQKKKITMHNRLDFNSKKFQKFTPFDITIEKAKPYFKTQTTFDQTTFETKLLIDTGNSDALWIFQDTLQRYKVPTKNFNDFLGKGFSGEIYGKRAKINRFEMKEFEFKNPLVSFPDSSSTKNVRMVLGRNGSIGGEICRRFTMLFDYKNKKLYLKKNNRYNQTFTYNKSGIILQHNGLKLVQEVQDSKEKSSSTLKMDFGEGQHDLKYKFELKPVYAIMNIRKNSPAEVAGIKAGDTILSINGIISYKFTLEEITNLLKADEEKNIEIEVEREGKNYTFHFKLTDIL
jgi:hypothetical protein